MSVLEMCTTVAHAYKIKANLVIISPLTLHTVVSHCSFVFIRHQLLYSVIIPFFQRKIPTIE